MPNINEVLTAYLQYIGARYVPKFFTNPDDQSNDWKAGTFYEALTIVTYNNDSYTSKVVVPDTIGNPASNPEYWACTTKYTAALVALQTTVSNIENKLVQFENVYNTVAEMAADSELSDGMFAMTLGFYTYNDKGAGVYKIRGGVNAHSPAVLLSNGLYAELVLDSDMYDAKALGFKAFSNESDAYTDGGNSNRLLWEKYICDGANTYHTKIKFDEGIYPFDTPIAIPNSATSNESYEICGAGGASELYFPNGKGLIPIAGTTYAKAKLHDIRIHAYEECIDFYNGSSTDCAKYIQTSFFNDLYVVSDTKVCISAYPYVFTHHSVTDYQQFNNTFKNIHGKSENDAIIQGFNAVGTRFENVSDRLGKCKYIFRNCGATFEYMNTAYNTPDWFIFWDDPTSWTNIDIVVRNANIEGYMEGFIYLPDLNCASRRVELVNCDFTAVANVGGSPYVRTHHPINLGGFVMNFTYKNIRLRTDDNNVDISDVFANTDCLATVYNNGNTRLENSDGDVGEFYNRQTNLKTPANTLTNSLKSAYKTWNYTRYAGADAYISNNYLTQYSMGNIIMLTSNLQVTTELPANTPMYQILHSKPLGGAGFFAFMMSGNAVYRLEVDNDGLLKPSVNVPTGYYRIFSTYLGKGFD